MTPLQQAAQALLAKHTIKSTAIPVYMFVELRKAFDAERAQAVEPTLTETLVAHGVKLRTEFEEKPRDDHVADAGKTMGERAALIHLRGVYADSQDVMDLHADDMLEADALQLDKKTVWIAEVKPGWALVPVEPTLEMIAAGRNAPCSANEEDIDADYCAVYKAMLSASQGAQS